MFLFTQRWMQVVAMWPGGSVLLLFFIDMSENSAVVNKCEIHLAMLDARFVAPQSYLVALVVYKVCQIRMAQVLNIHISNCCILQAAVSRYRLCSRQELYKHNASVTKLLLSWQHGIFRKITKCITLHFTNKNSKSILSGTILFLNTNKSLRLTSPVRWATHFFSASNSASLCKYCRVNC